MLQGQGSPRNLAPRGDVMLMPDEVSAMVRLHELGWGLKRIAGELGCSRNTVKRYIEAGGWVGYRKPRRRHRLDGFRWPSPRFGYSSLLLGSRTEHSLSHE